MLLLWLMICTLLIMGVELINAINVSKARSAWAKGVKNYALNLVEEIYQNDTDIVKTDISEWS